jgi:hypothetical protein
MENCRVVEVCDQNESNRVANKAFGSKLQGGTEAGKPRFKWLKDGK